MTDFMQPDPIKRFADNAESIVCDTLGAPERLVESLRNRDGVGAALAVGDIARGVAMVSAPATALADVGERAARATAMDMVAPHLPDAIQKMPVFIGRENSGCLSTIFSGHADRQPLSAIAWLENAPQAPAGTTLAARDQGIPSETLPLTAPSGQSYRPSFGTLSSGGLY